MCVLNRSIFFGLVFLTCLLSSKGHLFVKDGFVGIGIDFSKLGLGGKCPPTVNATCQCGHRITSAVQVPIPVCSYTHRWKLRCKPCDDKKDTCQDYLQCQKCHADGGKSCATCPEQKFGKWCENDCDCQNGALCERDGKCTCSEEFEGRYCEKRKGCNPPGPIEHPLQVHLSPPLRALTAVYSCPPNYELRGSTVSTCLPNDVWSSKPPKCLPKCPLLSAPANGRLVFSSNELVEGVTATVTCNSYHRMVGEGMLSCLRGGQWSGELPICERLASCPDPGNVKDADKKIPTYSVKLAGHFIQDSRIEYQCKEGYEQLGSDAILCLFDGTWSNELPSCVKFATVIPDCQTKGSDVVSAEGVSVRIVCPPECADEDFQVWGTSIYRKDSSVCQAAIHSGKITNSGGQVAVIANGPYSGFTGSDSNNVQSESYDERDESFRFDKLPPISRSRDPKDCQKGQIQVGHECAYISNNKRPHEEAEAVCSNMGLQLNLPQASDSKRMLLSILNSKNIKTVWGEADYSETNHEGNSTEALNDFQRCPSIATTPTDYRRTNKSCDEFLNFVCLKTSQSSDLAICSDPGRLPNGKETPIGKIDNVFYVGSSIEFTCDTQHYLKGVQEISCLSNGSWSDQKPTCVKVNACTDPPVPIGGFVTFLPPMKSPAARRAAAHRTALMSSRTGRIPIGLSVAVPENLPIVEPTTEPETISLPPGLHRIGARAMYDCESRYYKLIGSRTRRCQGEGDWSGRPPTCIPICGRSDSPRSPFIVNGNATDIGQWPWQAGIARYLPDYNQWFLLCGASLLNEMWVITAAHCVTYAGTTLTIDPDKFQVYLGKYHRQDSKDDEYVQVRKIREIHIHPDYDPGLFDADIALIQMDSPVQLNSRVQPICLPTEQTTRNNLVEGKKGVVTGWGMDENNSYSETLQQAVLPVVPQDKCEKGYEESELPLTVTENMYCAGFEAGRADACSGDSGGPMVFTDDSSKERKWVLEGIVSWGSPQGCGNPKQYGGFTTVSQFLDWIHLYF